MFLLCYRDPYRYGAWNDRQHFMETSADEPFTRLTLALNDLAEDTSHDELGIARVRRRVGPRGPHRMDGADLLRATEALEDWHAQAPDRRDRRDRAAAEAEELAFERQLAGLDFAAGEAKRRGT